jgi:hypothetical protein
VNDLRQQGLGLAVITYDPVATLARFADERGLTFPLLSDRGSEVIRRFGLLNTTVEPGNLAYGVPFPGTFLLDREGRVVARYFEEVYQERNTVASILAKSGTGGGLGPAASAGSAHLEVTARASYRVVRVDVDPQPWLRAHPPAYPPSEIYHFVPLDERVEVYQRPFRLVQDLTILATPEAEQLLARAERIAVTARLVYQACDDKICYTPASVPLSWTLEVTPLLRRPRP